METNKETIENSIKTTIENYKEKLSLSISKRVIEMEEDNLDHLLLYEKLGISKQEGLLIDLYQNKGRFLYKYAGSLMEDIALLCFKHKFPNSNKIMISNTLSNKPKNFEIDCLIDNKAIEIKWKDSTTDGDHINKEHQRVMNIVHHGYTPIRIMFYEPNRIQSKKVQSKLKSLYKSVGGEYHSGIDAFKYVENITDIDLYDIMRTI